MWFNSRCAPSIFFILYSRTGLAISKLPSLRAKKKISEFSMSNLFSLLYNCSYNFIFLTAISILFDYAIFFLENVLWANLRIDLVTLLAIRGKGGIYILNYVYTRINSLSCSIEISREISARPLSFFVDDARESRRISKIRGEIISFAKLSVRGRLVKILQDFGTQY